MFPGAVCDTALAEPRLQMRVASLLSQPNETGFSFPPSHFNV